MRSILQPLAAALAGTLIAASPLMAQSAMRAADARPGATPAATAGEKAADPATPTAIGGGSGLVVGGIEVDVAGKSAIEARLNGWREAQREAWPALWSRMSGLAAESAPRLSDSALDSMVSAIEIEREQIGPTRYVARLAVIFDRGRASSYLGRFSNLVTSPPYLLLPVFQDAATRMAHEPDSPWLQAWARLRAGESPIDYIRIQPTPGDTILLNAWAAQRRHLFLWQALVDRYQVADVMIPELILERSWAGGPATGLLIVRFGPTGRELGRVRISHPSGDIAALADRAVREADRIYVAELRAGKLLPDPELVNLDGDMTGLEDSGPLIGGTDVAAPLVLRVRVATPDDQALQFFQRSIAGTPGVSAVRVQSLALGGESMLDISTSLDTAALRLALDARGLRLDGNLLRRRVAGEAPLAPALPEAALPGLGDQPGGLPGEDMIEESPAPQAGRPRSLLPGGGA